MTRPAFQRRHYESLAALLATATHRGGRLFSTRHARMLADMLAADNPPRPSGGVYHFDRARFLTVAAGKPWTAKRKSPRRPARPEPVVAGRPDLGVFILPAGTPCPRHGHACPRAASH